jgi:tRNA U34 5-methylaminomethyl-2-thiouridine-forming methyltransferase MnmC
MAANDPAWQPLRTADGSWTLASRALGEACHSRDGAWREARERYARPTQIAERARRGELPVCRLLDVGTGLGLNLAAALEALDGTGVALDVLSLEIDRSVISLGLECMRSASGLPPSLARWHGPVAAALERALELERDAMGAEQRSGPCGVPLPGGGRLRLRIGDGRRTLPRAAPEERFDAVFLDPFSPGADPALWEAAFLGEVARRMASGSVLSTFSAAFRVRARLAGAGLLVGAGPRVGRKAEGTLASPDRALPPLPPRVARRLARA